MYDKLSYKTKRGKTPKYLETDKKKISNRFVFLHLSKIEG